MTYKGYKINLRPYKIGVGVWNLRLKKTILLLVEP
jgi:hypothetical protein